MQTNRETWDFTSLESIGGHSIEVIGNPILDATDRGKAIAFDGKADQVIVHGNPIGDSKTFTFEVVFQPAAALNRTNDPRFIHVQDPDDPEARRLMLEIRVNDQDQWVFDAFLLTGLGELMLMDKARVHRTNEWAHVAVTYDGKTFSSFVDGKPELSGPLACKDVLFSPKTVVSVGARMNRKFHLQGMVKTIRVTREVLDPMDFIL